MKLKSCRFLLFMISVLLLPGYNLLSGQVRQKGDSVLFNDSHFHLTNYIQEGITATRFLEIMGNKVGRSTLFGIPLQQQWSYLNSKQFAPTYYLETDAPLYYYSFTDAAIAMQYTSLSKEQQARFDPMITGFNPADMYAAKHIERVLKTYPGVFTGIGEFSIHKEFVSAKISGETASLNNPALDSILAFASKTGLLVIIHNDIDMPMAKGKMAPIYYAEMKDLLKRHRDATIIWAHIGLGRIVHPVGYKEIENKRPVRHIDLVEEMLSDPELSHVYFDISWDEVAKYIVSSPSIIESSARVMNKYPDRFLFGSDVVAPKDPQSYFAVYEMYSPFWKALNAETSKKVRTGNYLRLFDAARIKVRGWEKANIK